VTRDTLGVLLAEGLEFIVRDPVEILGNNIIRDDRIVVPRSHRPCSEGVTVLRRLALPGVPVAARRSTTFRPQSLLVGLVAPVGSLGSLPGRLAVGGLATGGPSGCRTPARGLAVFLPDRLAIARLAGSGAPACRTPAAAARRRSIAVGSSVSTLVARIAHWGLLVQM
jgi:hypothetical protein